MCDVNDRIQHKDGEYGTIRYVGPVCSAKDLTAEWLGIEWDGQRDDTTGEFTYSRGKHDGSVVNPETSEKVQYFECPDKSGSFVKADKLRTCLSIQQALAKRYEKETSANPRQIESKDVDAVMTIQGNQKAIEFVGANKTRFKQRLECIQEVDLSNYPINTIGAPGELKELAPHIERLGLQNTLFSKWKDIAGLNDELSELEELVLSGIRFDREETIDLYFPRVSVLVLNRTLIPWIQLQQLNAGFPNLKELFLKANELPCSYDKPTQNFSKLELGPLNGFANLEKLDLSCNQFDWGALSNCIGKLPQLRELNVENNKITNITSSNQHFLALETIFLSGNQIDDWGSVDALNNCPKLATLRFSRNPLTQSMGTGEARQIVVSRIKNLQFLNGSEVRERERSDYEKLYLKRILQELAVVSTSNLVPNVEERRQEILQVHPRYEELQALYKQDVNAQGTSGAGSGTSIAQNTVSVEILSMAVDSMSMEPFKKKLPLKMTVGQLKMLLQRKFKLDQQKQLLSFRQDKRSLPVALTEDECDLSYYGVQDKSQILMNEIQ